MTAVMHMELLGSSGMQVDERNEKNKKRKEGKKVGKKEGWKGGRERRREERKMEGREAEGKHLADFCTGYFKKLYIFSWINYW